MSDPMKLAVYGAAPIGGEMIPLLELTTSGPVPPVNALHHRNAAWMIANALWETLPQGTIDNLFAEMARRQASMLSVRCPAPETSTT